MVREGEEEVAWMRSDREVRVADSAAGVLLVVFVLHGGAAEDGGGELVD